MRIQQVWASLVGIISTVIGILKFISVVNIPALDASIHIITGIAFIVGAWIGKGRYVRQTNLWLGIFYIIFGTVGMNWPHIIVGIVSVIISLSIKIKISAQK